MPVASGVKFAERAWPATRGTVPRKVPLLAQGTTSTLQTQNETVPVGAGNDPPRPLTSAESFACSPRTIEAEAGDVTVSLLPFPTSKHSPMLESFEAE